MKLELGSVVSSQLDEILSVDDELGSLEDGSELDVSLNELEQSNVSLDDEMVGVESLELLEHADGLPSDELPDVVVSEELLVGGIEHEVAWPLDWSRSEEEDMTELPEVSLDDVVPDGSESLDGDVPLEPGSPVDDDV